MSPSAKLFMHKYTQRNQKNPDMIKICRQASLPPRLSLIQFAPWIQWPGKNANHGNKSQTIYLNLDQTDPDPELNSVAK